MAEGDPEEDPSRPGIHLRTERAAQVRQHEQPLGAEPRKFSLRYVYNEPCQKVQIILYRSSRKGTLRLHHVDVVPVRKRTPQTQPADRAAGSR